MGHYLTWESMTGHVWVIILFLLVFAIGILIFTGGIRPIIEGLSEAIGGNALSFD